MPRGNLSRAWGLVRWLFIGPQKSGETSIIVLRAESGVPREHRITRAAHVGFRAFVAFQIGLGVLIYSLWDRESGALSEVVAEADALREQNRGYALDTEQMSARVQAMESQMQKLALLVGAEPIPAGTGGTGGSDVSGYAYVGERLDDLSGRVTRLGEQGVAIERMLADQRLLLASTPTIWPVRGLVSSGIGPRPDPFTGEIETHFGLDIAANTGTPVRAPADGRVTQVGTSATLGRHVVIHHGFDTVTRYAHLSEFTVRRNQRVRRGEVIGLVGNTGRSRAPHLHYEVWVNDRAQDPLRYIVEYRPPQRYAGP